MSNCHSERTRRNEDDRLLSAQRSGFDHASRRRGAHGSHTITSVGRRGRYNVERLIAKHRADAKLPDLMVTLTNCDKARSVSIYDRCKAVYEGL
jgi:hypothetical protein